jgi:hypothetical protein
MEAMGSFNPPVPDVVIKPIAKEEARGVANKFYFDLINTLIEKKLTTWEYIKDHMDEALIGMTSVSSHDGPVLVKYSKLTLTLQWYILASIRRRSSISGLLFMMIFLKEV